MDARRRVCQIHVRLPEADKPEPLDETNRHAVAAA